MAIPSLDQVASTPLPVEVRVDAGAGDDSGSPKGLKPGALSALLREIVATPEVPEVEPTPLLPGTIIGRFELARELGRGAFGVVYEARDRELGRLVALKIVRPGREGVTSRRSPGRPRRLRGCPTRTW